MIDANSNTEETLPSESAVDPCGDCGRLANFLVDFDPGLQGGNFNAVDMATKRLDTQKEYLEQFVAAANEQRTLIQNLERQVAQKDVRDERIDAIKAIVAQKVGDSAKIGRIQKLLE
ncbi:MAG: hypothetical protein V3S71_06510 [Acidobacteriota bacterium]